MAVIIPTNHGLLRWRQLAELDTLTFGFAFSINRRDGFWRVAIDRDGTVLLAGIKLVLSADLLAAHRYDDRLPLGTLRMIDLDGLDNEATEENFGDRVVLAYDEVA